MKYNIFFLFEKAFCSFPCQNDETQMPAYDILWKLLMKNSQRGTSGMAFVFQMEERWYTEKREKKAFKLNALQQCKARVCLSMCSGEDGLSTFMAYIFDFITNMGRMKWKLDEWWVSSRNERTKQKRSEINILRQWKDFSRYSFLLTIPIFASIDTLRYSDYWFSFG